MEEKEKIGDLKDAPAYKGMTLQIIETEEDGVSVLMSKTGGMTETEMLGHLEYAKASITQTMLAKTKDVKKDEKPNMTLDGVEIPKFDKGNTTL